MSVKIAPSILSADFGKLNKDIATIEPYSDLIHVDVMDGHFVPNISFGAVVARYIDTKLPLDIHLMIENPEDYVEEFVKAGFRDGGPQCYVTVHAEAVRDLPGLLQKIRDLGAKSGVSIKPGTPVSEIRDVLDLCDLVLIMTVEPGFGGQSFMEDQVSKIERLRELGYGGEISVDGGINGETSSIAISAGADILVVGSYIFGAEDREKAIESLKN